MFGHMTAEPIRREKPACPVEESVVNLTKTTDETQAVQWIEFPAAVLLFVIVSGDPQSGAVYVLDRKTGIGSGLILKMSSMAGTASVISTSSCKSTTSSVWSNVRRY